MQRLTRPAFTRWLQSKPDDFVFRGVESCFHCPIAEFLREHGAPAPYVWLDSYTRDERFGHYNRLPPWATWFSRSMKRAGDLTRDEALRILTDRCW